MITELPSHLLTEQSTCDVLAHRSEGWIAAYLSRKCPFKEGPNEDCLAWVQVDDEASAFIVADGCGGMRGGEQASRMAVEILRESLTRNESQRLRPAILDGIEQANEAIRQLKIGAARTLAVVEIQNGVARPYHVGDAKILIMGGLGKIRYQSICHSPVGFAVESGWLEADDAMHHEDRHLVSNVVGCERMRIEIGPAVRLGSRDTIAVASDGLFDNVSVTECVDRLRKGDLSRAVSELTELADSRMHGVEGAPCKPDDLSLIAIRMRGERRQPHELARPR